MGGGWNLPPAMHRLTYLAGIVATATAVLCLYYGASWPLVARISMAWTALVGFIVAALASTRRSAFACRGVFGKNPATGSIPLPWVLLLWPYHVVVQLVCQGYRSSAVGENLFDKVADRLYLGGWPLTKNMLPSSNVAILDVTNELIRWVKPAAYRAVLVFESWAPEPADMQAAVEWVLAQRQQGHDVFVHCTHGHGRSAVTAAAVLMALGEAATVDEALAKTVKARPGVKPNFRQVAMLREWAAQRAKQE